MVRATQSVLALGFSCTLLVAADVPQPPRTVAETSGYKATSRYADVVDFCERLARQSPIVRLGTLGISKEGRKLPLVVVADPPVATAAEARASGKLVLLAIGNIHAGEVDGKEALLMLARDLALAQDRPLLKHLVLVFAPIFNADGNEKMAASNRPEQAGPKLVGIRENAQDLDLNRDFVKLESPEVKSLVRFFNEWDPAVFIDCHTTNGSYHRYLMTYEGGRCPAGDPRIVNHVRDVLLPEVSRRLKKESGIDTYFYGVFSRDRSRWETVPPTPRYGVQYVGLRNRIGVLSESYSYAPYRERVRGSYDIVKAICVQVADRAPYVARLLNVARQDTVRSGDAFQPDDRIVLRSDPAPVGRPHQLLGYLENGSDVATARPREYEVLYYGGATPTLSVTRPFAYLLPPTLTDVVDRLGQHGVRLEALERPARLEVEVYRIDRVKQTQEFQKHRPVELDATVRKEMRQFDGGTLVVRMAQPLGSLVAYLLEPQSDDGLATWNFFDGVVREGKDFPVVRLPAPSRLATRPIEVRRSH
jgi:hypothetical protein